jgi:nitroreductase
VIDDRLICSLELNLATKPLTMDVIEAITTRYTVRAFQQKPVSKEILEDLLIVATRSPSWANTQTWEFAIVGTDVMDELRRIFMAKVLANDGRHPDIARPQWPPLYNERSKENIKKLYQLLGITRENQEKHMQWLTQMYGFFGAPNCIIVYTDKELKEWAIFNIGLVVQNITLAALHYGLGTAILAAGVSFPDEARNLLHIPQSKQLVISIAIGYPNLEERTNKFRSNRVPLSSITTWHGL